MTCLCIVGTLLPTGSMAFSQDIHCTVSGSGSRQKSSARRKASRCRRKASPIQAVSGGRSHLITGQQVNDIAVKGRGKEV